jgi:hypothetical protein
VSEVAGNTSVDGVSGKLVVFISIAYAAD